MKLLCAAKINLTLDITGKRPDQYHSIKSIFQTVSVYDRLKICIQDGEDITLICESPGIPRDERNLAYKAADLFLKSSGMRKKIDIYLKKGIPSGAGMGGGSADAAGVLYALNELTNAGYTNMQLRDLGVKLGADVPFLLMGGTVLAEGIGEILTPVSALPELSLVIVKGKESVSTPEAYRAIDQLIDPAHPDTDALLTAIRTENFDLLCQSCGNLFEAAIDLNEVKKAKEMLLANGAQCAVMTGSGSAVFGIFKNALEAIACKEELKQEFIFAEACHMTEKPFKIIQE